MTPSIYFVALDLGAGSGRAMLGAFDGTRLTLEEAHRFSNEPVPLPDGIYWDALRLYDEMRKGLAESVRKSGCPLSGVAVDTWGVDYGLLDKDGRLLANPRHYRDVRTNGILEKAFALYPREKLFGSTGIQFMPINTVFQLLAQRLADDPALAAARHLLWMPDLFNYWFTGERRAERTIASTGQCYNPKTGAWADDVLKALDVPRPLFADLVSPGTVLGPFRPELAESLGLGDTPVIAVGSHDTASAVAAVPLSGPGEAYLSSGTWSLLGVESKTPVITEKSLKYNFTNEVGVADTIRLLKNITGLWIVQEMRRTWLAAGEKITYDEMGDLAQQAEPFALFINPDDPLFMPPGDMAARIVEYAARTGQPAPASRGAMIRAAFESLAFKYRWVLDLLDELSGQSIHTLYIVGGGTRNTFMNQWTASATGRVVKTGPTEATAAGNVLLQMIATGHLNSLAEARAVIRASFPSETIEPVDRSAWNDAYQRYLRVTRIEEG